MAKVLILDDESGLRIALGDLVKAWGHETTLVDNLPEAKQLLEAKPFDLVLSDVMLYREKELDNGMDLIPFITEAGLRVPIVMMTGKSSVEDAVKAMEMGAENYITKPVEPTRLRQIIVKALEKGELIEDNDLLRKELRKAGKVGQLVGRTAPMQNLYNLIERVAASEAAVCITGESGTGKSMIAQTIHEYSRRRRKPFVAVNCAAISPTLIESELFGHEKGSFTGAIGQRRGYFEDANTGTIFLDEITELPIELQGKLLRVLEENRIRRVGGTQEIEVNVRLISATNRDPKQAIADGKLREDLYYRINIFPIHAPSLRERADDVPFLAQLFLQKLIEEEGRPGVTFDPRVLEALRQYNFPGNVRELRNVCNRALILAPEKLIELEHLPEDVTKAVDLDKIRKMSVSSLAQNFTSLATDANHSHMPSQAEVESHRIAAQARAAASGPASASAGVAASTNTVVGGAARGTNRVDRTPAAGNRFDPMALLPDGDFTLETLERVMIQRLLNETGNNKPLVADMLGISLKTLYNKIKRYES